jgi:hypothetical protein
MKEHIVSAETHESFNPLVPILPVPGPADTSVRRLQRKDNYLGPADLPEFV